jgi:hypothetical protein
MCAPWTGAGSQQVKEAASAELTFFIISGMWVILLCVIDMWAGLAF